MLKEERFPFWFLITAVLAWLAFGVVDMARADRIDEITSPGNKAALCTWKANHQARGEIMRYARIPLAFRYATQREMAVLTALAEHEQEPHDAVYLMDDGLTDQEKTFWQENVAIGWHEMDQRLAREPGLIQPNWNEEVARLNTACMNGLESRADQPFVRVGSADTVQGAARCSIYVVREGSYMLAQKQAGMTLEQMLNPVFFGPDSEPQYINAITGMIHLLYSWTGTDDEWRAAALKLCWAAMSGKDASEVGFVRVASNKNIGDQEWKKQLCLAKTTEADEIMQRRVAGQPLVTMRAELDATKMTAEQRAEMVEMLEAAYAWKGTRREFLNKIWRECMR